MLQPALLRKEKNNSTTPDNICAHFGLQWSGVILLNAILQDVLRSAILGLVLPAVLLGAVVTASREPEAEPDTQPTQQTTLPTQQPTEPTVPPTEPTEPELPFTIGVILGGERVEMELEEYVTGVVLAEMPAAFAEEALKAQAVAARTYALRMCGDSYHNGAVCTDPGCCQSYLSPKAYVQYYGTQASCDRVRAAVAATAGEVLTYQGRVIYCPYFSCSGGSTESAVAVWGSEIAYLQAVDSPGEEFAYTYQDVFSFTWEEFQRALGIRLEGDATAWFGAVCHTAGGGVDTMEIGGVFYRGTTLRALLGLPSTRFSITVDETQILVETLGYGHRVGMSQYGAEAMAQNGSTYSQILAHYYTGTQLQTITD